MGTLTELKQNFQTLITSVSPDLAKLWESYVSWDNAFQRERGSKLPHAQFVLDAIQRRDHIDPTTASLGVLGLHLATIDYGGRTGQLLEGIRADKIELVKPIIERMTDVAYNPRSLNRDNK